MTIRGETTGRSAALHKEIMRTLPLAAAVFDRDMRYLGHSPAWLAVHGLAEGENLEGRFYHELLAATDELRELHQRCLAGVTDRRDLELAAPDGQLRFMRWHVTPWREGDRVEGTIVYVENVTEQVLTQRRLEEREDLLRDLFDKSPVGLNLCRMDGLWLESNRAFCDIIGYTREEADGGLTYWQLTPRKYDAEEAVQLERLRTIRRYGPYEKEFIRKDGRLVPVRLNGFLIEREGQTYIWSLIEDLTSQRALEADLEGERLKAIQASKLATVGEMAAGIAHELNNPLSIIDAFAFALQQARTQSDGAKTEEAVRAIRDAVGRAGKIVRGLRKFTRQPTNEPPVEIPVEELIEESLALCQPRLRGDDIEMNVAVATDAYVMGHSIELAQVLVNLINNAVDAVGEAKDKWVRLAASETTSGTVRVTVEDSGPGVPPEDAERVFRAFFTTKKVGEGTGLGLSISRSIVERHGGTLTYDGSGAHTRFVLELPRARRPTCLSSSP